MPVFLGLLPASAACTRCSACLSKFAHRSILLHAASCSINRFLKNLSDRIPCCKPFYQQLLGTIANRSFNNER
ncbi:hypothetical protein O3P69_004773 [Scylla paramamosain]|uniref:Secreted protein n=1 Tax=Scylla paramamosain TaxID=85552 RepID=A0AAW0UED0_SCYPA